MLRLGNDYLITFYLHYLREQYQNIIYKIFQLLLQQQSTMKNRLILIVKCFMCVCWLAYNQEQNQQYSHDGVPGRDINRPPVESLTQKTHSQQRVRYHEQQQLANSSLQSTQLLFPCQTGLQQFILTLPSPQRVSISMYVYQIQNNVYTSPSDIESTTPIKLFIYQNNNRLIYNADFYFQNYAFFQGTEGSTYTLRYMNAGDQRLVIMHMTKVVQNSATDQKVKLEDAMKHANQARILADQVKFILNGFQRYALISSQAVKAIFGSINMYFYWNIFQTATAVIVCAIQLTFIRSICKHESIV